MAGSQLNFAGFEFNQEELKQLSEVIGEMVFSMRALTDNHEVEEGILYNKQIVFSGRLGMFTKAMKADCTTNEAQALNLSEKTWTPGRFEGRLVHCSPAVNEQNKLINQFSRMNPDFYNVIDNYPALAQFLITAAVGALQEEIPWKAWFSDVTADNVSGGGIFTNGFDTDLINVINGLWTQIETDIPDTASQYVEIAKNAGTSYADQELEANEGLNILRSMYKKADSRLLSLQGKRLMVTRTIYDNLLTTYEEKESNGGLLTRLENGGELIFRGIPVVNMMNEWDQFINSYLDNGTTYHLPNRALLTVPSNIPLGTVNVGDFDYLDAFYDKKSKTNNIDAAYNMDAKFLESYLAVAAY